MYVVLQGGVAILTIDINYIIYIHVYWWILLKKAILICTHVYMWIYAWFYMGVWVILTIDINYAKILFVRFQFYLHNHIKIMLA